MPKLTTKSRNRRIKYFWNSYVTWFTLWSCVGELLLNIYDVPSKLNCIRKYYSLQKYDKKFLYATIPEAEYKTSSKSQIKTSCTSMLRLVCTKSLFVSAADPWKLKVMYVSVLFEHIQHIRQCYKLETLIFQLHKNLL